MKKLLFAAIILLFSTATFADDYLIEEIEFPSHGIQLSGSLVLPADKPIKATVVFVHGSGKQTRSLHWAKRFADAGIAALVYDKRGAGKSGGIYESNQSVSGPNIALLADDAVAAVEAVQSHPNTSTIPVGLTGISQAGWIVPIAAEKAGDVDFMVLWSGPVCKVSEEDIYSKYTRDLDSKRVPSYAEALNARTREYIWPDFLGKNSDPSENLARLAIPGLWVFGEQDGSVPIDLSVSRLKTLISAGKPYEYVLFSSLGHNNMTETFNTVTDWIDRQHH